jgi:peptidoglycan/xylan/chitin deacetylase (PgdA/CDA1 family)
MIGRVRIKRAIKQTGGWAAVLTAPLVTSAAGPRACILVYHRIAEIGFVDPQVDDWNVSPEVFERQVASLAAIAEFVPLIDLPARLSRPSSISKQLVCLTFDDGYANFFARALPVLKQYRVPATLFVVTNYIGKKEPLPFDGWSVKNGDRVSADAWRPINWEELENCLASGLVTIGSHSHRHLNGRECSRTQLVGEALDSKAILQTRLGQASARAYAYPYGSRRLGHVPPGYVNAVREAGYELAVTTDLGLVSSGSDNYALPRIEAHGLDSPAVLRAKVLGRLFPYYIIDRFRKAERGSSVSKNVP